MKTVPSLPAKRLDLTWEQVSELSDVELDAKLFGERGGAAAPARPEPDWS